MEKKITCSICKNEENKFCTIKKSGVALNKRRHCDKFVFEPTKVKEKQILKTVRLSYAEKEVLRRHYREELKKYKQAAKEGKLNQVPQTSSAHPLTGDLTRFVSTAGEEENGQKESI